MALDMGAVSAQLLHQPPCGGMAHAQLFRHLGATDHNCRVVAEHADELAQSRVSRVLRSRNSRADFPSLGNAAIMRQKGGFRQSAEAAHPFTLPSAVPLRP